MRLFLPQSLAPLFVGMYHPAEQFGLRSSVELMVDLIDCFHQNLLSNMSWDQLEVLTLYQ